jgi:hypothetical protein
LAKFSKITEVFLKITKVAHYFGLLFPTAMVMQNVGQKNGWAKFWVISSKLIWSPWYLRQKNLIEIKARIISWMWQH